MTRRTATVESSLLADPVERLVGACEGIEAGTDSGLGSLQSSLAAAATDWSERDPDAQRELRDACVSALGRWSEGSGLVRHVRKHGEGSRRSFAVVEHVLANEPSGASAAAREFDRMLLSSNALSALRARRVVFTRELLRRYRGSDGSRPFRVAALNAGPAPELIDFLSGLGSSAANVHAVLVDGDENSLVAARERADGLGCRATIDLQLIEPARATLLQRPFAKHTFDFIYSPALFDYVPDDLAARCLEHAFAQLAPGGSLFIAHYHRDLTVFDRVLLEWWLGWFPYFRAPKELARVLTQTTFAKDGLGAGAVRGPNVYAYVEKKA